ncbi:hypothetical protein [Nostocoides sp. HKS02]|uniref:hypothetical protein n=1 Tax=Nostocoides sp. HKS02 TaxID=1813880 RepID=UPI0012B4F4FC|nr:hypothetical protein [Tetrasphaera sp. HKS02]QGN57823.1 hypothetical protein GKE56_07965 [Tetrasphaera sp. HKS02]
MNDFIALSITRSIGDASEARSALPHAPVVDDGYAPRPARAVRRSLATTLRTAAAVEHRWANRLDPAAC